MKGDKGVPQEGREDGYQWFNEEDIDVVVNPRTGTNPGWQKKQMESLRENIQAEGLKQRLEVRMVDGKPRLVAGGRRLQCVRTLKEENATVYNRNTKEHEPATKVYAKLCCLVTDCANDKEAMKHAVMENLLHEHLTDYDLLLQCQALELADHSRAEQAKVFAKSEAWVSQSHSLLAGNPKVLEAMAEGVLGRTQALRFLNVDTEKVESVLKRSIERAKMELAERESVLLEEREKAYDALEEYETQLMVAQTQGNPEQTAEARAALQKSEEQVEATDKKLAKLKGRKKGKPNPSINNIEDAARDEKADKGPARHMPMTTVRKIADKMTEFLANETLINPATGEEYSIREFTIVRDVLDCILRRNKFKTPLDVLLNVKEDEVEVAAAK